MKEILFFDLKSFGKNWKFLILFLVLIALGIMSGNGARFTLTENLAYNSPYQIAFITAFLSLVSLFFTTIFSAQLALKEMDYNFNSIFFSLPIQFNLFLVNRICSIFILSFSTTLAVTISFFLGREMSNKYNLAVDFNLLYYALPVILFTFINTLFIVSITVSAAWFSKSKLMVYISGLVVYVIYMVALIFSGSPFMANQLPQSEQAQFISALVDPFGLSAFFYQTSDLTISQRNTNVLHLTGVLLLNRIGVILFAFFLLFLVSKKFSILKKIKKSKVTQTLKHKRESLPYQFAKTEYNFSSQCQSFFSFSKTNWLYILKSIPFILLIISVVFVVGMELYAEIEKGIRMPQKYATSGLMTSTIINTFYVLGAVIVVFYANDLYWRSKSSNFDFIEKSTPNYKMKFWSIIFVLVGIIFVFSTILIFEGICFQLLFDYPKIELLVYSKTYLFTTLPLVLVAIVTLVIQKLIRNKYVSLGISGILVLLFTTSLGKSIIQHPLLKFLFSINFDYSDMNGFGTYEEAFTSRLTFGFIVVLFLLFLVHQTQKSIRNIFFWIVTLSVIGLMLFWGNKVIADYAPKNPKKSELQLINYEKKYRKFQNLPQPTITNVISKVDLFPNESRYTIKGRYTLQNKTKTSIEKILFNFSDNFKILKAELHYKNKRMAVSKQFEIIQLTEALNPNEKAVFSFEISYQWQPINGHQSFNAIVENGSFMRISRFFPQIGYQENEIKDVKKRRKYQLRKATEIKSLDAPKVDNNDFIDLDMLITTEINQTAIGIGELVKHWKYKNRAYFRYKASKIPFRFAISSAEYAVKKEVYKNKLFEVYYHPSHYENVANLITNAKITMDYCETNFSNYPFKTIRFAEVSSFTQGFNATAYPATIYMTEQMAFHCNIKADKQQDVINELAGHELAHMWWGNSQISPDYREGEMMLTETLAMYTELMLLKKMYGKSKAEESVKIHQDIYESEKGFLGDTPLLKVTDGQTHIAYSKGALAMFKLSELIGEDKVNLALKNFLINHKYPNSKPISTDFLKELYKASQKKHHSEIKKMFCE